DTGHYAKDCKATTRAMYFKYFKRRILLENKEESEILLNEKEYDFLAETDGGELESIHDTYVMEHDDSDDLSASRDMDQSRGEDKYDDVCHEQGCSLIATLV
ncbi:hypothetical protein Tco_0137313, partial [Tanacetum coccineum]